MAVTPLLCLVTNVIVSCQMLAFTWQRLTGSTAAAQVDYVLRTLCDCQL